MTGDWDGTGVPEEGGLCGGDGSSAVLDWGVGIVLEGTSPAVALVLGRRRRPSLGSWGRAEIDDGSARGDEGSGGSVEGGKRVASRRGDGGRRTRSTVSSSRSMSVTTVDIGFLACRSGIEGGIDQSDAMLCAG